MHFINVVNENETKWTYFRLIIHPAQVERSGVQEGTSAGFKPVGQRLLINTSEDGNYGRFERTGRRLRHEEGEKWGARGGGLERGVTRNVR